MSRARVDRRRPERPGVFAAALLALLVLCLAIHGRPVPAANEFIYLLLPLRQWDGGFLANDWTLAEPWYTHWVFNFLAGPLALVLPVEALGWIGRIASWTASLAALLLLGRRFDLGPVAASAGIALWLILGQSLVGGSWMIGTFEAKCVAYLLAVLAVFDLAGGHTRRGSVALGLAFSFHPHVGLMAGLGAAAGALALRLPVAELARMAGITVLFGLPGAIPILQVVGEGSAPPEAVRFLAQAKLAVHLDPWTWPRREILLYFTLFAFNAIQAWPARDDPRMRFLLAFEAALAAAFAAGLAGRAADGWRLLQLTMPFRMGPLVTLLFFGLHLMRAARRLPELAARPLALGLCALSLLGLGNPLGRFADQLAQTRRAWLERPDDVARALEWVGANTPEDAIVLAPPTRHDAWHLSRRAQVVTWIGPTAARLGEWHERVTSLGGDAAARAEPASYKEALDAAFHERDEADMLALARRYGAGYLVSRAHYGLPVVYETGGARVYAVE